MIQDGCPSEIIQELESRLNSGSITASLSRLTLNEEKPFLTWLYLEATNASPLSADPLEPLARITGEVRGRRMAGDKEARLLVYTWGNEEPFQTLITVVGNPAFDKE